MDDLISRQAAIDILYDFAGCIVDTPNGYYCKKYKECRHRLEQLPSAQPEPQWIPCSERLPEAPDAVLVTIDFGDGDCEVSIDEYWSVDGVETEGWGNLHGGVVTAWTPLLEPYKEENNG